MRKNPNLRYNTLQKCLMCKSTCKNLQSFLLKRINLKKTQLLVEKHEMYSKCPSCRAETSKYAAEVYICKNPNCKHVDARQLITMLQDVGLDETVIGEVRANIVLKAF